MFEIGKTEVQDEYAPIPNGMYPAFVDEVMFKASKAGAEYMNVKFKIFGDNYANRVVWNIYNVMHPKEQVRNIAFGDLKKMFTANGMEESEMDFTSKEQLAAAVKDCRVYLKLTQKTDDYGTKNVIKGYDVLDEKNKSSTTSFTADSIPF